MGHACMTMSGIGVGYEKAAFVVTTVYTSTSKKNSAASRSFPPTARLSFCMGHVFCMYMYGGVCRVFERYPDARALFSRVNVDHPDSPEWKAHLIRITNGLDIIVNMMDDPTVLFKEVEHLANQHAAREGMKGIYITVK